MTKVIMQIGKDGIFFDCSNHSDDHDVCTIVTALCNVLVAACERANILPEAYEPGHVKIVSNIAENPLTEVFSSVMDVFCEMQEDFPEYVKVY